MWEYSCFVVNIKLIDEMQRHAREREDEDLRKISYFKHDVEGANSLTDKNSSSSLHFLPLSLSSNAFLMRLHISSSPQLRTILQQLKSSPVVGKSF